MCVWRARGESDPIGDLPGRESPGCPDQSHDGAIRFVQRDRLHLASAQRHAETDADFLQHWSRKPGVAAGRDHALDAAAPLLHQAEFMQYPANDPIAQLRDAHRQIGDGEAEGQQSRVLDLQPVVEQGDANRCATLRIVGVRHRVYYGLAHGHRRQGPVLAAP